jgi:hypothetical protein
MLLERKKIILGVSLLVIACTLASCIFETTLALRQSSKAVPTSGSVKGINVGIYWNSVCTNQTSSISWGILESGSNKTVKIYVRNEGNAAATLAKTLQNWNPSSALSYMTLNWDYQGQTLSVNQVLAISLTLVVSSAISGISSFSFDLTITATG